MKSKKRDVLASKFDEFRIRQLPSKNLGETLGGNETVYSIPTDTACTAGDEGCCDTDSRPVTDRGTVTTTKNPWLH